MNSPGPGRCERCEPLGGNTLGNPNLRYVYILEPNGDFGPYLG